jgi:glutamate-5-semialdehyde dehydrogenase
MTHVDFACTCAALRRGAQALALLTAAQKNAALLAVAASIEAESPAILAANRADVAAAEKAGIAPPLIDRLRLTPERIADTAASVREVAALDDPIGCVTAGWTSPGGLRIREVRVPIGVAALIYESRPAVTVDAFALAFKSGNAILLRGSSAAGASNAAFFAAIQAGLAASGQPQSPDGPLVCALLPGKDHAEVDAILTARGLIDVVLPRGGAALIRHVVENARVPVIETGSGVCHLYIDESADVAMAVDIAANGKLQRPGVCNALECFVVLRGAAPAFLAALGKRFEGRCVLRCDAEATRLVLEGEGSRPPWLRGAADDDFGREFLDNIAAVKVVGSLDEAIRFINDHNTRHSECIVTSSLGNAARFQREIDAACVYVNASTRFTDGGEFGFGLELGISTQKVHVRGPMGLKALTTTKYLIDGEGQIR